MYLKNLLHNLVRFLKVAVKSREIFWIHLISNRKNCKIDEQARVYGNHILNGVTVGKGTYISTNAYISNTTIGKFCSIGPNLLCGYGYHPIDGISSSPAFYSTRGQPGFTFSSYNKFEERKDIVIGNDVFIGMNVTILDGVTIGDGAVIGAGAVVTKDIPPYAVAVGCPIKVVKYRFSEEVIRSLLASRWWDRDDDILKEVEKNFLDVGKFLEVLNSRKE